jgi:superfamily II DNA or RNA helicase
MHSAPLPDFDPATLASAVGAAAFAKGFQYAQQQAVVHSEWNSSECALRGLVRGQGGHFYATAAFFSVTSGLPPVFELAECSCPVEFNCKHAVALVLTATAAIGPAVTTQRREQSGAVGWEHSLDALLGSRPGASAARSAKTPLAIELTLAGSGRQTAGDAVGAGVRQFRLYGRLVRPGKNVGWISGGLSWGKLDSLSYSGEYVPEQVRLLRELHALYRSRGRYTTYNGYSYGSYGDERSLEISAIDSRQLWPLLDEADAAGLRLVYTRKLGAVPRYGSAELDLDVTRRDACGPLVVGPVIRAGEPPSSVVPVAFIGAGSGGHGLVYLERGDAEAGGDPGGWRFRLARLRSPASPHLQQMALTGQRLEVPVADQARFLDSYYPRLRRAATLTSSDGSFSPPPIEGPDLVLRARYSPGHDLEVSWEWAYRVGDSCLRAPLDDEAADDGYRDPAAERALLAGLDLPLDQFGLARRDRKAIGSPPTLLARARLAGLDTMRFTTELLPLLADQPGVVTDITGEPADYREAGDSLRIAVATDEVPGDMDWFDLGVMVSVEERQVPFLDVFLALSRGEPYLLLPDGAYFSLDKPELQALRRLIEEARALQEASFGELRISRYQAGLWEELAGLGVIDHQASAWREQVTGLLSAAHVRRPELPSQLRARLRPYQHDGFGWLAFLWEHRLGGILADDMGLGKTLQSLALICHAKQAEPGTPPFLIVAPTSVVANWAAEAARFTPGLKVVPVSDTVSRRGQSLGEHVAGADAVVTSYALLRIDFAAYAELGWAGLFLDEAQNAKNRQSKIYQCVRRLVAPVKIAITGTPLENNLMELWSLLSITAPGLFPNPVSFSEFYARPIEKDGDAELLDQLQRRIKPLVKRRTKQQVVADLPAKQEQVLEIDLHPQHRRVYETHLQRERQKVLGLIHDMNANRFTIFRSLTLLRQLSLHAGLVDDVYHAMSSAKIDALLSQLGDVTGGGHRALVFSQFTGFLGKVRAELEAAGLQYCYLDGSTRNRPEVIEQFKAGAAPVFLISLKAGGFGLNLAEADYCFLLDPWWNPATEAQAVDRIHRIGQTRNVMVYRLVARDTIEEKVMALKARKAKLFSSVMDHGDVFSTAIDADDIRRLLA